MPHRPSERVVAILGVSYHARVRGPTGALQHVVKSGDFGDTIILDDPTEEARLDALGALAAPGAAREDVERERDFKIAAYREARSSIPDAVAG